MSGKKFHRLLRYVHACDMHNQPDANSADCTPIYKVKELMELLENRHNKAFVPFYVLSLDETLIKSFGRIKFKVRIATKAARYGIKAYVIADAKTAYVLKVVFCTGKYAYHEDPDSETVKKTVNVVKQSCEPYKNSCRCVYVDRFHTSI